LRSVIAAVFVTAAAAAGAAAARSIERPGDAAPAAPTFSRDIAPILFRSCVTCHHPGTSSPFSLLTYADVRPRARQIAAVTRRRYMPPWKPEPESGDQFVGARRLSESEITTIERWVDDGAVNGDPADLPAPPHWTDGWRLGVPDAVVRMPEPFELRADGPDVFRIFVLPIPTRDVRYVKAIEVVPGTRAVHHANLRIDETATSRGLDAADPAPGYDGLIASTARYPEGYFLGWTPGQLPPMSPELAWRLNPGSDLVVQLHVRPSGRPERVQIAIGLYFADGPPPVMPAMLRLGKQDLDIPPGDNRYVVTDSYVLPVDVDVYAVQPHAHYRARTIEGFAALPAGATKRLIRISDWDFDWQDTYRYVKPIALPKGTTLTMRYEYDNSNANRRNPQLPPQRVRWGQRSTDEMGDLWIQVAPRSAADHALLTHEFRQKVFREDILGYETVLRTAPGDAALHDDVALLYMAVGRYSDAVTHFSQSVHLKPEPAAHFNLGTALAAVGHVDEAMAEYREALRLQPDYAFAENNLGALLLRQGRLDEAAACFRRAIEVKPNYGEAHNNLAKVLAFTGRPADAVAHLRRALELAPDYAEAHYNLAHVVAGDRPADAVSHYRRALALRGDWVPPLIELAWLLATSADAATRDPAGAIPLAERAVALTARRDPVALDVLAAAYAASGQFDRAILSGRAALALVNDDDTAAAVTKRLALYAERRPYLDVDARGPLPLRP
jgi:tetratricopeptide (TPR) repeat protein